MKQDPQFFGKILWSDEFTLQKGGYVNMHILHSKQLSNLHLMREERSQYQFKIHFWTGILNVKIIEPFELPGKLSGQSYLNFLQNDLLNLMEEMSEESSRILIVLAEGR
ncbi:unnamed protein product [Parnassius apollo]|uniref:(apollo) hypothetical protein n=1 Tax=Parnassius apollo TaxID=110799 RepID=A0A8S3WPZ5_PARAO|nr:unnamed protein product [Parnassius apollo]